MHPIASIALYVPVLCSCLFMATLIIFRNDSGHGW